jgi:hypothetical protein
VLVPKPARVLVPTRAPDWAAAVLERSPEPATVQDLSSLQPWVTFLSGKVFEKSEKISEKEC